MTAFYSIYAPLLPVYRSFRIKPVVVRLSVILTICLWQAFGKTFARHLIVPSFRCYKSLKHPIIRCSFRNYFILLILFYFFFLNRFFYLFVAKMKAIALCTEKHRNVERMGGAQLQMSFSLET